MKKGFQNMLIAVCAFMVLPALGQTGGQYNLSWNTIDGGGGRSTSGPYVLTGTIAQPDAGYSAGGGYELFGGFWAVGCFPYWHPDYNDWIDVARPRCWCYPRQCHGDADGLSVGKNSYWVYTADLDILWEAWGKPIEDMNGNEICADFDHKPQGKNSYRVFFDDLRILQDNFQIPNGPEPNCFTDW